MRSTQPMPGNPWPHDMVLTISNDDQGLEELLWVREVWHLEPTGDVPPPAESAPVSAPTAEALRQDKGEWEKAWTEMWAARLQHVGKAQDHGLFEAARVALLGSVERSNLLDELRGPNWRDRFTEAVFDEGFQQWTRSLIDQNIGESQLPLDQHPERRCLDALIPAWERGLRTLVVIPCSGDYTRTVGTSGLCLTHGARLDPARYRLALHTFGS